MKSKFGIGFNPFVSASHVQCKSLLLLHWTTRASSGACTQLRPSQVNTDSSGSIRAVTNQWGSPLYMFDYDFTFRQSEGLREPWKESKSLTPLFLCRPILLTLRCFCIIIMYFKLRLCIQGEKPKLKKESAPLIVLGAIIMMLAG